MIPGVLSRGNTPQDARANAVTLDTRFRQMEARLAAVEWASASAIQSGESGQAIANNSGASLLPGLFYGLDGGKITLAVCSVSTFVRAAFTVGRTVAAGANFVPLQVGIVRAALSGAAPSVGAPGYLSSVSGRVAASPLASGQHQILGMAFGAEENGFVPLLVAVSLAPVTV